MSRHTNPLSYTSAMIQRRNAMLRARNAKFYAEHTTNPTTRLVMKSAVRESVKEARASNRIVIARIREWLGRPARVD